MKLKVGCVLMAAGDAKRFGENKLNRKLNGKSLIDRAFDCIPSDKLSKVVVVSQYDEVLKIADSTGFASVKNIHPDYGISYTIKLGLEVVDSCDAVMFMVSDQPLLSKESVAELIDYYQDNPDYIVGLGYNGTRGNPCIFPKEFYNSLKKLREDHGGSSIIREHEDRLKIFEAKHPDELSDIDTKLDLQKLQNIEVRNGNINSQ